MRFLLNFVKCITSPNLVVSSPILSQLPHSLYQKHNISNSHFSLCKSLKLIYNFLFLQKWCDAAVSNTNASLSPFSLLKVNCIEKCLTFFSFEVSIPLSQSGCRTQSMSSISISFWWHMSLTGCVIIREFTFLMFAVCWWCHLVRK